MNSTKRISVYYKGVVGPAMPGKCAYAFTVHDNDKVAYTECDFRGELGNLTSIQAQYVALVRALDWLLAWEESYRMHVRFYGDNQFVTNQVNGLLVTTMDNTGDTNDQTRAIAKKFKDIAFTWSGRALLEPLAELAENKLRDKGIIVEKKLDRKVVRAR